ncbi:LLM class flavin-dependent oxidoreductase [Nonomuraea salmonea]|uniref:LLM class flavin-dependent oxidoreductase n=1 Tax=Nonomuraea salmonea TaxID=46181 RepID=UPI002FEB3FA2
MLPAFGLTPARPADREAFPVPGPRGAVFDESLELLRLLLSQEKATFYGEYFTVQDVGIGPLPPKPLDIWVGGSGERALRRAGRLADGWLASFLTPDQAAAGRTAIAAHAAEAGREIEADHYGTSLAVATTEIPATALDAIARRNPGADPAEIVPVGWPAARTMIERFVEAGITKFVVRPATPRALGRTLARRLRHPPHAPADLSVRTPWPGPLRGPPLRVPPASTRCGPPRTPPTRPGRTARPAPATPGSPTPRRTSS